MIVSVPGVSYSRNGLFGFSV